MLGSNSTAIEHRSKRNRATSSPWKVTETLLKPSWSDLELVDPSDDGAHPCDDENDYESGNAVYRLDCFRDAESIISSTRSDIVYTPDYSSNLTENHFSSTYLQPTFASTLKSRLTLSAFRRPEQTIRLTTADPCRKLSLEYDLQAPDCGVLGHGAFSTVRSAIRRRDGLKVAVKSIAKHEALRSRRLRYGGRSYLEEWEILRRFQDHPNVITLLDLLENDEEIQIVTEYCRGGELFDAIQRRRSSNTTARQGQYSECEAAVITHQILSALVDLHDSNVVHRDVKPENIVLANDDDETELRVKLCDFGVARPLVIHNNDRNSVDADNSVESPSGIDGDASPITPGRSRSFSTIGTDYYAAPELVFGGTYNTAVDIYSLGVVLYILLCGFPPVFTGQDSDEVAFPNLYWSNVSADAKNLLRRMLHSDASERITARSALNDQWLQNSNRTYHANRLPTRSIRSSHRQLMSSSNLLSDKSGQLDLELVRNQLLRSLESVNPGAESPEAKRSVISSYEGMTATKRMRLEIADSSATCSPVGCGKLSPLKRARFERRVSSAFLALADLYRDVAAAPSGVYVAAAVGNHSEASTPQLSPAIETELVDELISEQHERTVKLAALSF